MAVLVGRECGSTTRTLEKRNAHSRKTNTLPQESGRLVVFKLVPVEVNETENLPSTCGSCLTAYKDDVPGGGRNVAQHLRLGFGSATRPLHTGTTVEGIPRFGQRTSPVTFGWASACCQ
eukprot:2282849-Rhodomonas_salina.3